MTANEPKGLIFVIEYDHAIVYCGDGFIEARELYAPKMGSIHVWMFGKWLGDVNFDGEWTFKTKYNEPVFESLMEQYRELIRKYDAP